MLALTRKKGDSIVVNGNIEIVVLEVGREQVKIGIKAPKEIPVYRKELLEQIKKENKQAVVEVDIKDLNNLFK